MKYQKLIGHGERYLYTDWQNREWEVWRQAPRGDSQWAIKCLAPNMEIFDDAFWTRTSAVKQIVYLENPENELHERKMHRKLFEKKLKKD